MECGGRTVTGLFVLVLLAAQDMLVQRALPFDSARRRPPPAPQARLLHRPHHPRHDRGSAVKLRVAQTSGKLKTSSSSRSTSPSPDRCPGSHPSAPAMPLPAIGIDAPAIAPGILNVLRATQSWLHRRGSVSALYDIYELAESRRKGRRARLTKSLRGRERRAEWRPRDTAPAEPLHYRWGNVRQLLIDLRAPA
jgi:hypothetical protein